MVKFEVATWPQQLPYDSQSFQVPDTKSEGQTAHLRNAIVHDLPTPGWNPLQTVTTTYECFEVTREAHPLYHCLGHRPIQSGSPEDPSSLTFERQYLWLSYGQVAEKRLHIGSAIQTLFNDGTLGGGELPTVGTWTINRPEWQLIDLALSAYSKVGVALYSTLGKDAVGHINHSEITLVFVAARNLLSLLSLAPKCPKLRFVVSIDPLQDSTKQHAEETLKSNNIRFMTFLEFETFGKAHPLPPMPPGPDTIATICYSSGTTANPKGVVLTHWNLASSAIAFSQGFSFANPNPNVAIISYLPLAHIVGRVIEYTAFLLGCAIGYYTGDPLKLLEDCQILKPTIFPAVPRVLNRIVMKIQTVKEEGGLKGKLLKYALDTKVARVQRDGYPHHWFWDFLIFNKLKAVLGGKVEYVCSGAAPLVPEALYTLRAALGCEILEGWGLTETCGSGARTLPADPTSGGTVGTVSHNVEVKLVDVPSLGYSVEDKPNPRGELCVRGTSVFREYYKEPKLTADVKDADGWFHSGDVGEIDSKGRVKVIDRIKNVMKLSQGEYVATDKVENGYATCPLVFQLFAYGQSSQNHLVGILVPDLPVFAQLVSKVWNKKVEESDKGSLEAAAKDPEVVKKVASVLGHAAKDSGLQGFEKVKKFVIILDQFTTDNGMMTPTFKLRRKEIEAHYKDILEQLYTE
ncbi:acetyl-CoA synthetase-like protein [Serendipita vermifera]|nr:acetyl-CoA synthetase-like protein [Serendipita vermifera]